MCFATGESSGWLTQADVTKPHVFQSAKLRFQNREVLKELVSFLNCHGQDFSDGFALKANLKCLPIVPFAMAYFAGYCDIGQELHFDLNISLSTARLTASSLHVKRKASGFVAACSSFGSGGEQLSNASESSGIRRRIRSRSAPNGRLIDIHYFIDMLNAQNFIEIAWLLFRSIENLGQLLVQDFINESALAATGDAGYADECPQRDLDIDVLEVILTGSFDDEFIPGTSAPFFG